MSQKQFNLTPSQNIFQLINEGFSADSRIEISQGKVRAVWSNETIEGLTLSSNDDVIPAISQQLVLLSATFNQTTIEAFCKLIPNQDWTVSPLSIHLGVEKISVCLSERLSLTEYKCIAQHCNENNVDLIEIDEKPPTLLKPGLVVLDMDSTSITIECIDEIAKLADVGEQVAEITELAMQGKLDFSESLRSRVSKLKGIEVSLLDSIANNLPLMPGMADLAKSFKQHGWRVAIASGGFTYFADNLKMQLGLDAAVSNTLVIEDGKLTGEVAGTIVDAQVKADTVEALAKEYDIELSQTIAIGDGANDLVMMKKAALGIAYHAKPVVQQQADVAINCGDLRSVIALLSS
ncbi:phosphoserine phosphatase SerB [Psychrobium sp. nBUS_13]|uniref:phosphoserine phosphatase SerB n=1 Tax=Psychrobium sp. nBUS_13 TaxID=3395319 RepID=UPI003EBE3A3C